MAERQSRKGQAHLRELIEEATIDCYGEHEEHFALLTMIEENVDLPFGARVMGKEVEVVGFEWPHEGYGLDAVCECGRNRVVVGVDSVEWVKPYSKGFEWIEAYLLWRSGMNSGATIVRRWREARRGRHDSLGDYYDYQPTIEAKGGIKAQSKRGVFGESWWAKRWIGVLERFNLGARLGRGRSYARKGQVLSIDISEGQIKARVQGSRSQPYKISIELNPLSEADWHKLARTLSTQAIFAAKLLAGEMPQEIETGFEDAGLLLFPSRLRDLATECSCPDSSNPCKHIAAVYYLIGEEFDRDPFLVFKLRGKGREEFIKLLGAEPPTGNAAIVAKEKEPSPPREPLADDAATFWLGGELPEDFLGEVRLPTVAAALPKRLGNFPFWRGDERFLDAMETVYSVSATRALELLGGFGGRNDEAPAKRGRHRVV